MASCLILSCSEIRSLLKGRYSLFGLRPNPSGWRGVRGASGKKMYDMFFTFSLRVNTCETKCQSVPKAKLAKLAKLATCVEQDARQANS